MRIDVLVLAFAIGLACLLLPSSVMVLIVSVAFFFVLLSTWAQGPLNLRSILSTLVNPIHGFRSISAEVNSDDALPTGTGESFEPESIEPFEEGGKRARLSDQRKRFESRLERVKPESR